MSNNPFESFDWVHAVIASASSVIGAAAGLMAGTWRMARIEPVLRLEIQRDIASMENDMRDEIGAGERRIAARILESANLFDETLRALRQKINDVEMEMVRGYVSIPNFEVLRREHREDMQRILDRLDDLPRKK